MNEAISSQPDKRLHKGPSFTGLFIAQKSFADSHVSSISSSFEEDDDEITTEKSLKVAKKHMSQQTLVVTPRKRLQPSNQNLSF